MRTIRLHMIFQWIFFLPIILPLCILFGALRGAFQMAERVLDQFMVDVMPQNSTQPTVE